MTLAKLFKSEGYHTGMAGKWHLGASEESWPTRQGFDEYHVGVIETTDGTLYRGLMTRAGLPESAIGAVEPGIWESDETGKLTKVRAYTRNIAGRSRATLPGLRGLHHPKAKEKDPFLLYVGFTTLTTRRSSLPSSRASRASVPMAMR